jgi:hypothetical protein
VRWKGRRITRQTGVRLFSPQLVIAIFDGNPAMVGTDCWPYVTSRSERRTRACQVYLFG